VLFEIDRYYRVVAYQIHLSKTLFKVWNITVYTEVMSNEQFDNLFLGIPLIFLTRSKFLM